ncbi:class I SAM-dependent rRNA methyltransferase [Lamprobacter modestohalophilus]|uniref:class I SAM-dependent rRNA methyltransferase n=1 Tax=Lamprobacter modestohalophilus TaxID=1064514 RepID=UPI002ADEFA0D|nr:class I SAM-dependent rRNA methyltransferase [Lamprobacter modestohalophilus]MEA1049386.1 class I SAM-dependent rRNA methyltransferase [Lamprobacter modestohalophilus]
MTPATLQLKKDQERRILAGHDWVYSNEIDTGQTPLKPLEPGQPVEVLSKRGRWLGYGYANPRSLIAVRITSRQREHPLTASLFVTRIQHALALRERLYPNPFYRLIHSEGDALPGLIVDRYGDLLVVQITTAGMERERGNLLAALEQVVRPARILLRNDTAVREQEGLDQGTEWVLGEDQGDIELSEDGLRFQVSPAHGQKTGWFFDQADNRRLLHRLAPRGPVLDCCCYLGAWGLQAAAAGARSVTCIDSAASALAAVQSNAALNGLQGRVSTLQGDAFDALRSLRDDQTRFEMVILDPPAFIKRRRDEAEGQRAYQRLNRLGLEVLEPGGLLLTSSCSFHMGREAFLQSVQQAARRSGCRLQLLFSGSQGPDHPIHPAISETAYLKTLVLRALD